MFIDQWTKIAPKHWTRKKLKHVASLRSGEAITADSIKDEGDFPVYGGNGLRGYTSGYTHEGEFVLIGRQGALCGNVNYARDRFWASEHAVVVTRLGDDDLTWLGELLRYLDLNRLSQSAAQPGISAEEVSNVLLAVPPLEEQRAMSAYLKSETTRLDALVTAKQRVLDLLAEKRKAIIAAAVTRGLDPKVKLRDSGVPWLGEIPAHWELWKVGHLAKVGNGSTPERDKVAYWSEGSFPWLNSSVVNHEEVTSSDQFVTDAALRECHLPRLRPGTVLVAITGQGKTRGQAVVLSIEATINQHMAFVAPDPALVDAWFLRWSFHRAYDYLRSISDDAGGTKGALTCEDVAGLRIPVPPPDEQRTIVEHIARETAKLDAVRAATERTIALLKERRSALIAAAVTGELDVGAAA
ncbi:restriction endonuclease subunit S [Myxococcota bacterium]|nr:restriction endonuclease subunit S [Myxococcota bacterium]